MRAMTQGTPVKEFVKEVLPPCDKPMVCGTLGDEKTVKIDKVSGKLATEYTPYTQIEEKKYFSVHDILYYVNTNDPLGDPLSDPTKDLNIFFGKSQFRSGC